jgi:predicted nucleic acid-binding Zn ribbon protein
MKRTIEILREIVKSVNAENTPVSTGTESCDEIIETVRQRTRRLERPMEK